MLVLVMILGIVLFLIVCARKMLTKAEGHIVHQMNQDQRRGFIISLAGFLFLSFAVLASIALSIIFVMDAIHQGQGTLGYVVFFYALPFGFLLSVGLTAMINGLIKIKPSYYSKHPREVSKYQIIVGTIGLIGFPFYYHFIKLAIHMTFIIYDRFVEFSYALDHPGFHTEKIMMLPFIAGPILLIIGGVIGYYTNNKQPNEKNFEKVK